MASSFALSKVPYLDIQDTCTEVDISRRQLAYWEEQGLITPELGADSKKYTVTDVRRLKVLRYLISDQKLPIAFVHQLVEGGVDYCVAFIEQLMESGALLGQEQIKLEGKALDFDTHRIVGKKEIGEQEWHEFGVLADQTELEDRFYVMSILLFRAIYARYRSPAAFSEKRDEILNNLRGFALIARIDWTFDGDGKLLPHLALPLSDNERNMSAKELQRWIRGQPSRIEGFRSKADELVERGVAVPKEHLQRFWEDWILRHAKEIKEENPSPDDALDDVPF